MLLPAQHHLQLKAYDNAFSERFVRTVRRECLDHILVWGERHLERTLREYVRHDNRERPHRGCHFKPRNPG